MESEKKIDEKFIEELEKSLELKKLKEFPITINVQQDDIPDIERWRTHE
ncbi:MAG: hypothetical protein PHX08_17255 [Lachnospiraceae bacterium]|nr:hypothetical protein [Lachnospiraceae bacterium]